MQIQQKRNDRLEQHSCRWHCGTHIETRCGNPALCTISVVFRPRSSLGSFPDVISIADSCHSWSLFNCKSGFSPHDSAKVHRLFQGAPGITACCNPGEPEIGNGGRHSQHSQHHLRLDDFAFEPSTCGAQLAKGRPMCPPRGRRDPVSGGVL